MPNEVNTRRELTKKASRTVSDTVQALNEKKNSAKSNVYPQKKLTK